MRQVLVSTLLLSGLTMTGCQSATPPTPVAPPATQAATSPAAGAPLPPAVATTTPMASFALDVVPTDQAAGSFTLEVYDAVTSRRLTVAASPVEGAATVIAPDGAALRTDEQGRVRLNLAGVPQNTLLLLVAVRGEQRLEAVHLFDATLPAAAYRTQQAQTIRLVLSATSTVGARLLRGIAALSATLSVAQRGPLLISAITQLNGMGPAISRQLATQPSLAVDLTFNLQRPEDLKQAGLTLGSILRLAGISGQVNTFLINAVRAIATEASDPANRADVPSTDTRLVLEGSDLVVEIAATSGAITLQNTKTGNSVAAADADDAIAPPPRSSGSTPQGPTQADVTLH